MKKVYLNHRMVSRKKVLKTLHDRNILINTYFGEHLLKLFLPKLNAIFSRNTSTVYLYLLTQIYNNQVQDKRFSGKSFIPLKIMQQDLNLTMLGLSKILTKLEKSGLITKLESGYSRFLFYDVKHKKINNLEQLKQINKELDEYLLNTVTSEKYKKVMIKKFNILNELYFNDLTQEKFEQEDFFQIETFNLFKLIRESEKIIFGSSLFVLNFLYRHYITNDTKLTIRDYLKLEIQYGISHSSLIKIIKQLINHDIIKRVDRWTYELDINNFETKILCKQEKKPNRSLHNKLSYIEKFGYQKTNNLSKMQITIKKPIIDKKIKVEKKKIKTNKLNKWNSFKDYIDEINDLPESQKENILLRYCKKETIKDGVYFAKNLFYNTFNKFDNRVKKWHKVIIEKVKKVRELILNSLGECEKSNIIQLDKLFEQLIIEILSGKNVSQFIEKNILTCYNKNNNVIKEKLNEFTTSNIISIFFSNVVIK